MNTQSNKPHRATGERHGNAKLTWAAVNEIRHLSKTKRIPAQILADRFEVAQTTISDVVALRSWRVKQ